jgi:hypothetical protein
METETNMKRHVINAPEDSLKVPTAEKIVLSGRNTTLTETQSLLYSILKSKISGQ